MPLTLRVLRLFWAVVRCACGSRTERARLYLTRCVCVPVFPFYVDGLQRSVQFLRTYAARTRTRQTRAACLRRRRGFIAAVPRIFPVLASGRAFCHLPLLRRSAADGADAALFIFCYHLPDRHVRDLVYWHGWTAVTADGLAPGWCVGQKALREKAWAAVKLLWRVGGVDLGRTPGGITSRVSAKRHQSRNSYLAWRCMAWCCSLIIW